METAMRSFPLPALALFCLLSAACASAPSQPRYSPGSLGARIEQIALRNSGISVAVAYQHLGTGATYVHDETESFHAASTMKVPVMMALFAAVENGALRLDQPIAVKNEFQSIVDGTPFSLDAKDDGDPDLYQAVGSTRTLDELIRRMITRSSNLATNILIEKIGASTVTDVMRRLGALDLRILRGVEDDKAFKAGLNNRVTAKDLAIALRALLPGAPTPLFSAASRAKMIEILKAQEFNEKIPAGLPKGTPVAHKTGDITGIHHDAAIVFPPGKDPYILVVLTGGFQDEKAANRLIAEISQVVWDSREREGMPPKAKEAPREKDGN
jgi:beta-lactamase class A